MPPKKASKASNATINKSTNKKISPIKVSDTDKNAISNMFKRIESKDSLLKECKSCNQRIKSCLFNDHLATKCPNRVKDTSPQRVPEYQVDNDEDIIFISSNNQVVNQTIKTELKIEKQETKVDEKKDYKTNLPKEDKQETNDLKQESETELELELNESLSKRRKASNSMCSEDTFNTNVASNATSDFVVDKDNDSDKDDMLLLSQIEAIENNIKESSFSKQNDSATSESVNKHSEFDYYLNNFEKAVESVISEQTFNHLLNDFDLEIIKKFSILSTPSKILYVRLFQRKFKWLNMENISYDKISADLTPHLDELLSKSFIIDENSIDSYEEMIYLLKLPQLKELAKICHVVNLTQTVKLRSEFIKLILQHFKTQKSLKFNPKIISPKREVQSSSNRPHFMLQCKKILGKCFKLSQEIRDVFVRILMLFSLSSTVYVDPNRKDNAQQNFLQILLVNIGKVKYMHYDVKLTINIFENRDALLRYQESLDYEYDLLSYIESKELEEAYEKFNEKIYEFKKIILNPDLNEFDMNLPIYLRGFTSGSTYCKFISIYAFEILQKLKKYQEANELFEFLILKQCTYLLSYRSKWYERLALNYETHLKNPFKAYEMLCVGLKDKQYVRKAGRLALYSRLIKMSDTKKYLKIKDLKDGLKSACIREKYDYIEAATYEIEGTMLQSEYIPGRKNIFIQNPDFNDDDSTQSQREPNEISSTSLIRNTLNISVEHVALTHYIRELGFTNGKHAETPIITTIYGLLFWDIIFDNSVNNVFVDKFQTSPLDIQTDFFYLNRKQRIDDKLDLITNSPIEFICELITESWNNYNGCESSLVRWSIFDSLEELISLIKCFTAIQLANLCKYICQNYRYCRSGGPDLIIWNSQTNKSRFVEVKGPGDRLSFKQLVWLDFFIQNSIDCEVCYVKGSNSKRLRQ